MQALVPIDSKKYLVLDGKTLEKKDALLPYDLLITDFCDGAKAVLEACLKDCEAFYFDGEWVKATLYSLPTCDKAFIPKQSYLNKKHFSYMDCVEVLDLLNDKGYRRGTGQLLQYKPKSVKRYLDSFDFISFLNRGKRK